MTDPVLCQRLLDVPLQLAGGGATNLGHFCGQKLVVIFCPEDPAAAAREIASYEALAPEFERLGAWLVGILERTDCEPVTPRAASIMNLGLDPDGSALLALARNVPAQGFEARAGATFLIDRDGTVRHAWPGTGHVTRALEGAGERP